MSSRRRRCGFVVVATVVRNAGASGLSQRRELMLENIAAGGKQSQGRVC
jgi:hypothetical protein